MSVTRFVHTRRYRWRPPVPKSRHFLLEGARASRLFAHRLVCTLASEGRPPQEAFSPAVKRSGWKPPRDTGLWDTADTVKAQVRHAGSSAQCLHEHMANAVASVCACLC